jgi:FkbM family methyltransferase
MTPMLEQYIYAGWYEAEERSVLAATLRADDVCLEVGGGIGLISTIAAQQAQRMTVYEANPGLVSIIERTVSLNGQSADVINAVASDADGTTAFYVADSFWMSSLQPSDGAVEHTVRTVSFDRVLADIKPTYLICDIEGGEVDLLGGRSLPDSLRAICVELHPDAVGISSTQGLITALIDQGYALDLPVCTGNVAFFCRPGD